jgi:hypothetical protein
LRPEVLRDVAEIDALVLFAHGNLLSLHRRVVLLASEAVEVARLLRVVLHVKNVAAPAEK